MTPVKSLTVNKILWRLLYLFKWKLAKLPYIEARCFIEKNKTKRFVQKWVGKPCITQMIRWIVANKLPYDSYLVRYWYVPICNRLFFCWSILFACAQFISSLFFGANFVFYAYCEESLRFTLLYHAILSRYHCLDSPTYCAFVIQINYSELFPICSYMIHLNFHIFTEYLRRYE